MDNEVIATASPLSDVKEKKKKTSKAERSSSMDVIDSPSPVKVLEVIPRKEKDPTKDKEKKKEKKEKRDSIIITKSLDSPSNVKRSATLPTPSKGKIETDELSSSPGRNKGSFPKEELTTDKDNSLESTVHPVAEEQDKNNDLKRMVKKSIEQDNGSTDEVSEDDSHLSASADGRPLSARDKLKLEKQRLKLEEEKLRKEEEALTKKVKEDKKMTKENIRKEKERLKKEKEDILKKLTEEAKREEKAKKTASLNGSEVLFKGWMKMRGQLKAWYLRYFVLIPGQLLVFKDEESDDTQALLLLKGCVATERASKRAGFCFKITHPLAQNIYNAKTLLGESITSYLVPFHPDHCILRVPTEQERSKWMNKIENAISMVRTSEESVTDFRGDDETDEEELVPEKPPILETSSVSSEITPSKQNKKKIKKTTYIAEPLSRPVGLSDALKEELGTESKSVILSLLKQVRIGMDLSRVALPTFILEPRSMLEKLSDYLNHAEILCSVPKLEDPLQRFMGLVKWYLSGFYLKPEGVKKPYNPVLGEIFRCAWNHTSINSITHLVCEQVSHHPPICAFYAGNRKAGWILNGATLLRGKFLGASVGVVLDGVCTVYIPNFDEEYEVTFPSAFAKGFLFGTLTMELLGNVTIICRKTGYRAEIEFKGKPLIGGEYNCINAKIKRDKQTLYTIMGKWDSKMEITDNATGETSIFWYPTIEIANSRIPKCKPAKDEMYPFESEKLWAKVTEAIKSGDQTTATEEKIKLEKAQREAAKYREARNIEWKPKLFTKDENGLWTYKYFNKSPWNVEEEIEEYERDGIIRSERVEDVSSDEESEEDLRSDSMKMESPHGKEEETKPTKNILVKKK